MTSTPETHWARTVDGACIAYQDIGEGPVTLLVVHGWVSHLEVYWEQPRYVRFLRRLSRNMRVLVFDKRGIGMSDRVAGSPDLGVLLDDVRAVMDAAGVEKAALLGWGGPGPELAAFFAATHPDRALCFALAGYLHYRWESDYPWGEKEDVWRQELAACCRDWGTRQGAIEFCASGFEDAPTDAAFMEWTARLARFSATPASYEAFERMWYETDVRPILPSIQVPVAVFCAAGVEEGLARGEAALIPGATVVPVETMVVLSFVTTTLRARPSCEMSVLSSLRPISSVMTSPPVRMAMSSSMRLRRSPKPGAFTATLVNVPRSLLTTRVARASPSTSSETIRSCLPCWMTFSRIGRRSCTAPIFWLAMRMPRARPPCDRGR